MGRSPVARARSLLLVVLALAPVVGGEVEASSDPSLGNARRCARYGGVPAGFPARERAGMVYVPAGRFVPGSAHGYPEERGDGAEVDVAGFYIDRHEVTNAQFAAFVRATGYVSEAEQRGGAAVFHPTEGDPAETRALFWWREVEGADWRHPRGRGSELRERPNHPVVQVTYADARAYAAWLGRTLPSEHEWEYAARALSGGTAAAAAPDGAPRDARGKPTANFFQGSFPHSDTGEDGFAGTAPVGCFAPGALGLHDMLGNVWEWTRDRYAASHRAEDRDDAPSEEPAPDRSGVGHCAPGGREGAAAVAPRVIKGGSFLCAPSSCARYRASARHAQEPSQPAQHLGFRTVSRP